MKFYSTILLPLLAVLFAVGCKKDENRIYYEGGTAPVLTASRTGSIPLLFANKDQEAISLSWTNPNYRFTTGVSSHNVTYQIEIDTTGANFTNPLRKTVSVSNDMSYTFTQEEFNDLLLNQLELTAGNPHDIEIRVKSFVGTNAVQLPSNVLKYTVTPYAIPPKVEPYTDKVFIVGSATPNGWDNPVPVPSQELTQTGPLTYEIVIPLSSGGSYLFLPENGSWSRKYGFTGSNNENNPNGDDFKREGGDLKAPTESGTYKIELNFQTGKFKLTKQ